MAAVALGLAALLNVGPMQRGALTSPFGVRRDLSLALLGPVSRISSTLGLDRPRDALDTLVGHGGSGIAPAEEGILSDRDAGWVAHRHHRPRSQPTPWGPTRHPWTEQRPLRLWVGGDSVAGFLTIEMVDLAQQSGVIAAFGHYKISTGLSRPDYFDWPAHLAADIAADDPEVVVFMVGANDDQPLVVDGRVEPFGSPGWQAEYARRVGAVMDMVTRQGRLLVWVGQPVMRAADFDQHMQLMNAIDQEEADRHPGVLYFDSRPVLSDHGAYAAYLPDASGAETLMRAPDGIHLSPQGGMRLAQAILDTVRQWWEEAPSGPPAPPRTY